MTSTPRDGIELRAATPEDGAALWRLVRDSGSLDVNSPYVYLLLGSHFAGTTVVAERGSTVVGFVAAYRPPTDPAAVFVWQIGVRAEARGTGLGGQLLDAVVAAPAARDARFLSATVTPGNAASIALFQGFARRHGVPCEVGPGFRADHFPEDHEREDLFRIGPLPRRS
jgi:L-2,4-diaminobutyric acid acetyltransferase